MGLGSSDVILDMTAEIPDASTGGAAAGMGACVARFGPGWGGG